ncbi:MAG: sulfatase family protein [Phycisphaeraceae bacterium]
MNETDINRHPVRRVRSLAVAVVAALACLLGCHAEPLPTGLRPPNVVLINADDLGFGDVGCYGATKLKTPNIDALAQRGRRFTDAHAASAVCSPSRYGLLTGTYPLRANMWGPLPLRQPLAIDTSRPTLASLFQQAGYDTACVGKWHLGFGEGRTDWNGKLAPGPNACGFDYYFGLPVVNSGPPFVYIENDAVVGYDPKDPFVYGKQSATKVHPAKGGYNAIGGAEAAHRLYDDNAVGTTFADKASAWIKERPADQPYFLYLATSNIHHPFTPAKRFEGTSDAGPYGDFVHELDWIVGRVVAAIEARGDLDNTLIIFTSDNGGMLNVGGQTAWERGHRLNGDLLGFKFGAWEGGHRVPFIAAWPNRIPAGTTSGRLVSHIDLLATFASLLDQAIDTGPDSIDQLPELLGNTDKPLRDELVVLCNSPRHLAIRTARWLYIPAQDEGGFDAKNRGDHLLGGAAALRFTGQVNSDVNADGRIKPGSPKVQLYDLRADPSQATNVAEAHPDVVRSLHARVEAYRAQIPDTKPLGWLSPQ